MATNCIIGHLAILGTIAQHKYMMEHFSSKGGQVGVCISMYSNKGLSFTVRIWVLKFACVYMCASVMSLYSCDYLVMSLYTHINYSRLTIVV